MRVGFICLVAGLLTATAEGAIYKCDRGGRVAYTSEAGPGCEAIEVRAPLPNPVEVERELERRNQKLDEERLRRESDLKAAAERMDKARDQQLRELQRALERQNQERSRIRPPPPINPDQTLEEPQY